VRGEWVDRNADAFFVTGENATGFSDAASATFLTNFSLVIGANLPPRVARTAAAALYAAHTPLILARACGLAGSVRSSFNEIRVVESHEIQQRAPAVGYDLRLAAPFSALRTAVDAISLPTLDEATLVHVPPLVLAIKTLDAWRKSGETSSSSSSSSATTPSRARLAETLMRLDARFPLLADHGKAANVAETLDWWLGLAAAPEIDAVPPRAREVLSLAPTAIATPSASSSSLSSSSPPAPFWFVAAALAQVTARDGALPVSGTVPDMTSGTESFLAIQNVYRGEAHQAASAVFTRATALATSAGAPEGWIEASFARDMCRHAKQLAVLRCAAPEDEAIAARTGLFSGDDWPPRRADAWALLFEAAESKFAQRHGGRWPGMSAGGGGGVATIGTPSDVAQCALDAAALWADACALDADAVARGEAVGTLTREVASEFVRGGSAELHSTAALIGGVVAQEGFKIIAGQYIAAKSWTWCGIGAHSTGRVQI
jgi:amyloid beta precursor protein binding protein 1